MRTGGTLSPDALPEKFVLVKKRGKESQTDTGAFCPLV